MKFFIYEIETGGVFCILPELPDNIETMEDDGEIIYKGISKADGVKFFNGSTRNVDWFYNKDGFEVPDFRELKFIDGELINGQ